MNYLTHDLARASISTGGRPLPWKKRQLSSVAKIDFLHPIGTHFDGLNTDTEKRYKGLFYNGIVGGFRFFGVGSVWP